MELPKSLPDPAQQIKLSSWLNAPQAFDFRRILESRLLEHKLIVAESAMNGENFDAMSRIATEAIVLKGALQILTKAADGQHPFEDGEPFDFSTFKTT